MAIFPTKENFREEEKKFSFRCYDLPLYQVQWVDVFHRVLEQIFCLTERIKTARDKGFCFIKIE